MTAVKNSLSLALMEFYGTHDVSRVIKYSLITTYTVYLTPKYKMYGYESAKSRSLLRLFVKASCAGYPYISVVIELLSEEKRENK